MGLLMLAGAEQSVVLWVLLMAVMCLAFWETRMQRFERKQTVWWMLLVLLIHVVGYLALVAWCNYRDYRRAQG